MKVSVAIDLLPLFGKYHTENESFSGYISLWNEELNINNNGANNSMYKIQKSVKNIVENKRYNILYEISNGITKLNDLRDSMEEMYKTGLNLYIILIKK